MKCLEALDWFRFLLVSCRNRPRNKAFERNHPEFALPPVHLAYDAYGTVDWEHYHRAGKRVAQKLGAIFKEHLVEPGRPVRYLEWGCGPGCVIRHMPEQFAAGSDFFATDYNAETIEWCGKRLAGIQFSTNQLAPPLAFETASLDCVCGLSVLTHLSEENCRLWMRELARVTRPNGLVIVTTKGEAQESRLRPGEAAALKGGRPVIRAQIEEGKRMYDTLLPAAFFRGILPPSLEVVFAAPGVLEDYENQDLWVLRRGTDR